MTSLVGAPLAALQQSRDRSRPYAFGYKFNLTRVTRIHRPQKAQYDVVGYDRLTGSNIPIANYAEYTYLVDVRVGDQILPVVLDTGSSDLWVVSASCVSIDCQSVPKYNPTNSSTLSLLKPRQRFQLTYLTGAVEGTVATETVALGPYQISNQIFALADSTVDLHLSESHNSGILGLAFASAATIPNTAGTCLSSNLLSFFSDTQDNRYAFFAIKLARGPSNFSKPVESVSSFTIGALDPAIVGIQGLDGRGFVYSNVSSAGTSRNAGYDFWKLPLHSITIDSVPLPLSRSLVRGAPSRTPIAVFDTGTTLVLGPSEDVRLLWEAVGGTRWNGASGLWEVRCTRGVTVGFVLGEGADGGMQGKEYVLHPADLNWKMDEDRDGWCIGGIQPNNRVNSGDWLLGDVFLRNVYVTHHLQTPTCPPFIGLLNMTDPTSAMAEFRLERGPDSQASTIQILSPTLSDSPSRPCAPMFAVAATAGILIGGMFMIVGILSRRRKLMPSQ